VGLVNALADRALGSGQIELYQFLNASKGFFRHAKKDVEVIFVGSGDLVNS
jgi:hypothetical protein